VWAVSEPMVEKIPNGMLVLAYHKFIIDFILELLHFLLLEQKKFIEV